MCTCIHVHNFGVKRAMLVPEFFLINTVERILKLSAMKEKVFFFYHLVIQYNPPPHKSLHRGFLKVVLVTCKPFVFGLVNLCIPDKERTFSLKTVIYFTYE